MTQSSHWLSPEAIGHWRKCHSILISTRKAFDLTQNQACLTEEEVDMLFSISPGLWFLKLKTPQTMLKSYSTQSS
jgi:hypothetical protein